MSGDVWIDANTAKPPGWKSVWVWDGDTVVLAFWMPGFNKWKYESGSLAETVTYWMTMKRPEPPQ